MKKQLLLGLCLVLLFMPVFAVSSNNNTCATPKNIIEVCDCVIRTALFGYELATLLFFGIIIFVMAKFKAPLTMAAPALFCFLAIFIGLGALAQVYSTIFLVFLIGAIIVISIGLIRLYSR